MILQTKVDILNWLKKYDDEFEKNIQNHGYEFIDIHDLMNSSLLKELIKKDNLSSDYFENLKSYSHQYIVNVKGYIDICNQKLEKIPFQFYHVDGSFDCSHNRLTSLKGCPQYVGDFLCQYNQITSLQYGPSSVYGDFDCSNNHLTSLKYCPQSISGDFYCYHNQLTSLEYFPEIINNEVIMNDNIELLKYKNHSNDSLIQNMSEKEFLNQRDFKFWQQLHFKEKIFIENNKIIDDLKLLNKNAGQIKIKKV